MTRKQAAKWDKLLRMGKIKDTAKLKGWLKAQTGMYDVGISDLFAHPRDGTTWPTMRGIRNTPRYAPAPDNLNSVRRRLPAGGSRSMLQGLRDIIAASPQQMRRPALTAAPPGSSLGGRVGVSWGSAGSSYTTSESGLTRPSIWLARPLHQARATLRHEMGHAGYFARGPKERLRELAGVYTRLAKHDPGFRQAFNNSPRLVEEAAGHRIATRNWANSRRAAGVVEATGRADNPQVQSLLAKMPPGITSPEDVSTWQHMVRNYRVQPGF